MTPLQKLAKARDLMRRSARNRATYYRATCDTRTARDAYERADRMSEEADRLFEAVAVALAKIGN